MILGASLCIFYFLVFGTTREARRIYIPKWFLGSTWFRSEREGTGCCVVRRRRYMTTATSNFGKVIDFVTSVRVRRSDIATTTNGGYSESFGGSTTMPPLDSRRPSRRSFLKITEETGIESLGETLGKNTESKLES